MEKACICKVRDIYKAITAFEAQLNREWGVNLNEAMALCLLTDHDKMSAGEMAEGLGLTPSNTSKILSSLERRGLVSRRVCKDDARSMRFHLGHKGIELFEHICCKQLTLPPRLQELVEE